MKVNDSKNFSGLPLWHFFEYLGKQGFYISVGEYLHLYSTINNLKADTASHDDLKYILASLIVKNNKDQEKFYKIFDDYFGAFNREGINSFVEENESANKYLEHHKKQKREKRKLNKRTLLFTSIMVLLLIGLGYCYYEFFRPVPGSLPNLSEKQEIKIAFEALLTKPELKNDSLRKNITIAYDFFLEEQISSSERALNGIAFDTNTFYDPDSSTFDDILNLEKRLYSYNNRIGRGDIIVDNISFLDIQVFLALLFLLSFIFYEYYLNQNQTFIAQLTQGKKPPYVWQFHLKNLPQIKWSKSLTRASHYLRKRVKSDELDFDVNASIKKTLDHGGIPELVYKTRSKPSEYLILVDKTTPQNHQASFYSYLVNELANNDVHIEQFYYQDDLLLFWEVDGLEKTHSLNDLTKKFPNHRLLIFGNAYELINGSKGILKTYLEQLEVWPEKAILTPTPSAEWGHKERMLSETFGVFPSNTMGLVALVQFFEKTNPNQLNLWKYDFAERSIELPENVARGIVNLKHNLSPSVFKWLCICAVYPQLFWDLTLYLGKGIFHGKSLVTQRSLQSLLRVKWFNEGFIPSNYRNKLLSLLDEDEIDHVRREIVEQMRKNPPKLNTVAHEEYKLNLLVNEFLLKDVPEIRKKDIKRELNSLKGSNDLSYYTEIKPVQAKKRSNLLDFLLPEEFRNYFKGPKKKSVLARTILFLVLGSVGIYVLSKFIFNNVQQGDSFALLIISCSLLIYFFVLYRFMRQKCVFTSFEVAFYWLLLSIALLIAFIQTEYFFFIILDSSDSDAVISFLIINIICSVLLILNQVKKEMSNAAVGIFYTHLVSTLWVLLAFVIVILYEIEYITDENILYDYLVYTIPSLIVLVLSVIFWRKRYKSATSVDRTEIAIYWLGLFFFSWFCSNYLIGLFSKVINFWIVLCFLILLGLYFCYHLFVFGKSLKSFIVHESFSIFWLGVYASLLMLFSEESFSLRLFSILGYVFSAILLFSEWKKKETMVFSSTLYWLTLSISPIVLMAAFDLDLDDSVSSVIISICNLIVCGWMFFGLARLRKEQIHWIELGVFWFIFSFLSFFPFLLFLKDESEFSIRLILIALFVFNAMVLVLWKIRVNAKFRKRYNLTIAN